MHGYGGKVNNTTRIQVKEHRIVGDQILVRLEDPMPEPKKGKKGEMAAPVPFDAFEKRASASLPMSKEEAAHYPVGSTVELHCVPAKGGGKKPKTRFGRVQAAAEASKRARAEYEDEGDED